MIKYSKNIGNSIANAIVITGAESEIEGVEAEYDYIARKHGIEGEDWDLEMQSLETVGNKKYDCLFITLSDGDSKKFYFDITEFFGK